MVMPEQPPKTPTIQGQISQRVSFQDVIDKNADRWAQLDPVQKREVADTFFDDQVIPNNAERWGKLDSFKQEETRRAFYKDFQIEALPDLRFDQMNGMERLDADLRAKTANFGNEHPIISDLLNIPSAYGGGLTEGLSAQGYNHNPLLKQGPLSNFAQSAGNTMGGIGGRMGLGFGLAPFLGPAAAPAALGVYGGAENLNNQIDDYGRNAKTINYPEVATSAAINALSGIVPGNIGGNMATRALTGAALNLPFGVADMAAQDAFEGRDVNLTDPRYLQQLATDAGAGAGLAALFGKRGGNMKRSMPPKPSSPISLRQLQDIPPAPAGALQGKVSAQAPLSDGWKFKPTKGERQLLKGMDPTRKKRFEAALSKRAEIEMRRNEMKASDNPVSYDQMLDDMAKEILAKPTEQRKAFLALHRKKVKRVAKRQVRVPDAEPSPDEQFSMDLMDAVDREIEARKQQGKAVKDAETQRKREQKSAEARKESGRQILDAVFEATKTPEKQGTATEYRSAGPDEYKRMALQAKTQRTTKAKAPKKVTPKGEQVKTKDMLLDALRDVTEASPKKGTATEYRASGPDEYTKMSRDANQAPARPKPLSKEQKAKVSVNAARVKQAVSRIAPDKTQSTQRKGELKALREDIQSRNNPYNVPKTEKSFKYVTGTDGSKDLTLITPEIAKAAGMEPLPVRLQRGYHIPKAESNRGEGFGLVHIEAGHGKDIRSQGFEDATEFVEYVLKKKNEIYTQGDRHIFVVRNGRSKYAIVELRKTDDGFYGVTTAFPEKPQYIQDGVKGRKLVWSGRNSQSQVGQPRSAEPATVSKSSDQVGYGARAKTSKSKNSTAKKPIEPPERKIPQSRHEGEAQVPDNPGKQSLIRQKTSGYETLDSLFEYDDAYNAYRELPKEHQQAIDLIDNQMKRGERVEIFGYDPKTGILTSGTGRKAGIGGDPNKLVTPIGWNYNHNTGEIKFIAVNNNFQTRQYIIPKQKGSFGANAVLASKQKGLVGAENNIYYKPGSFADPSEYVDHAVKKLPLADIAAIYESGGAVPPQVEARLRNLLNVKGDGRVEVYNHVREIMSDQDAFKQFVYDKYLKDSPLVTQMDKGMKTSTDAAKVGVLASRMDSKIRKLAQMTTGCK